MVEADHTATLHWVEPETRPVRPGRAAPGRQPIEVFCKIEGTHFRDDTAGDHDSFADVGELSVATRECFGTGAGLRRDMGLRTDRKYDWADVVDANGTRYIGDHYKTSEAPRDRTLFIDHGEPDVSMSRLIFKNATSARTLLQTSVVPMTNGPSEILLYIGQEDEGGGEVEARPVLLVDRAVTLDRAQVRQKIRDLEFQYRRGTPHSVGLRNRFVLGEHLPANLTDWEAKGVHISAMEDGDIEQGAASNITGVSVQHSE